MILLYSPSNDTISFRDSDTRETKGSKHCSENTIFTADAVELLVFVQV